MNSMSAWCCSRDKTQTTDLTIVECCACPVALGESHTGDVRIDSPSILRGILRRLDAHADSHSIFLAGYSIVMFKRIS